MKGVFRLVTCEVKYAGNDRIIKPNRLLKKYFVPSTEDYDNIEQAALHVALMVTQQHHLTCAGQFKNRYVLLVEHKTSSIEVTRVIGGLPVKTNYGVK